MSNKLKALRAIKGLDQIDVAKMIGICLSSYSQKESGKKSFTLAEAKAIADIFGLTVDEIFFSHEVINLKT